MVSPMPDRLVWGVQYVIQFFCNISNFTSHCLYNWWKYASAPEQEASTPEPPAAVFFLLCSSALSLGHCVQTFLWPWASREKNRQHSLERPSSQSASSSEFVEADETFFRMRNIQMSLISAELFKHLCVVELWRAFVAAQPLLMCQQLLF